MSNLESVNTSAPSARNSFCSTATLEPLHMESTAQWKLGAKKISDFAVRNSSRLAFLPPDTSAEERINI
ncbi:Ribonucleoside-diphosphate reductase subunit alpha [Dissostichus eleginoides]|uniref:Ribonucleoside-diphosphate reductase subunit alpha n=1 Tax=Dissostichus eleginoides TaxID=100907 RepID=A0AAD9C5N5_DISEL|nr:Ribonucleoside-diphosphate reductase subunit alpha [Dissostichus eleginoides]